MVICYLPTVYNGKMFKNKKKSYQNARWERIRGLFSQAQSFLLIFKRNIFLVTSELYEITDDVTYFFTISFCVGFHPRWR